MFKKTGYSRPHTVHCGPEGIYVSTLGGGGNDGTNGPPGVFIMDCETFDILGRWEIDRGPQTLHYDFWWNLPRDYMVTSEWALPPQFEMGSSRKDLLANKYGHRIHFWDRGPGAMSRRSILAPATRWRSKCARAIPFASTGSWASWSTPRISRFHMDLVARRRPVPHREDGDDSARAGVQGPAATLLQGLAPCRLW